MILRPSRGDTLLSQPGWLLLLCGLGCAPGGKEGEPTDFPADFVFGAAVAGFQVDPGCPTIPAEDCEDRASDWYQWVTDPELIAQPGNYLSGEPLSNGPGHWELYDEDFARAGGELGLDSVRVSLEWSRLFPTEPLGAVTVEDLVQAADPVAVAAYHDYLASIAAHGLEPLVTLNHYTLPLWLHDAKACHADLSTCEDKGWADAERMKTQIALYAGFCALEFGDEVDLWATLNEPFAVVLSGYLLPSEDRTNPPGVINIDAAIGVMWAMVEAHGLMYDAVHAYDSTAQVGLVPNLVAVRPEDPTREADVRGAEHLDYVYNRAFLEGTIRGRIDRDLDGVAEEERPDLVGKMDYIGVNYYTQITATGLDAPLFVNYPWTDFVPAGGYFTEYPEGLAEVLVEAAEYGLPLRVTENGTSDMEGATERFLVPHLEAVRSAIAEGADVEGYYVWSLTDNYEWNHGMSMTFGLYEVNVETKARTLRPLGADYAQIVRQRRL
jgi:beta-galactosidase